MDKTKIPLQTIADLYISTCRTEGKTEKTLRGYEIKLTRFVRWFDGELGDFSIDSVRGFIADLQQTEKWKGHRFTPVTGELVSPQTVANHVQVLKGFATWMWEEGYTSDNRLARMRLPKAPRKVIQILSEAEIETLLASIDADSANGCRDLAIITLFLDTGLRCAELVTLKLADVHLQEQWLKVMGKGQKERMVPIGARTAKVLQRYISFFRPTTYPWPGAFLTMEGEAFGENTVKMLFERLRKRSGITRLHAHLLRHTFATSYLMAGGDVFTLQAILGHTTLEMTRRYVTLASAHVNIQQHRFSPMDRMNLPSLRRRGSHRRAGQVHERMGSGDSHSLGVAPVAAGGRRHVAK